jgi:hypothetical protein
MISSLLASFAWPSCSGAAPIGEKSNSSRPEKRMKPRITMLTLGVDDLERSVKFYRDGLGFPTEGIVGKEFEHGTVAFFDLQVGLKLASLRGATSHSMLGSRGQTGVPPNLALATTFDPPRMSTP